MKIREEGLWAFNLADYTDPEGLLIDLPISDPDYTLKGTNHLKLVADVNGNLEFYVNDMENPVTTKVIHAMWGICRLYQLRQKRPFPIFSLPINPENLQHQSL